MTLGEDRVGGTIREKLGESPRCKPGYVCLGGKKGGEKKELEGEAVWGGLGAAPKIAVEKRDFEKQDEYFGKKGKG